VSGDIDRHTVMAAESTSSGGGVSVGILQTGKWQERKSKLQQLTSNDCNSISEQLP